MKLLKITQTTIDRLGRRIVTLWNGNSSTVTAVQYGAYGEDSNPVKDSIGIYAPTEVNGKEVCLAVMNKNAKAELGERRLYCTDENGTFMFNIWLRSDGEVLLGDSEVPAQYTNFAVLCNELQQDLAAVQSSLNDLINAFNTHVHPTAATGPPSIPTPVPTIIPVLPDTTDFSNIKHPKIKYNE